MDLAINEVAALFATSDRDAPTTAHFAEASERNISLNAFEGASDYLCDSLANNPEAIILQYEEEDRLHLLLTELEY